MKISNQRPAVVSVLSIMFSSFFILFNNLRCTKSIHLVIDSRIVYDFQIFLQNTKSIYLFSEVLRILNNMIISVVIIDINSQKAPPNGNLLQSKKRIS